MYAHLELKSEKEQAKKNTFIPTIKLQDIRDKVDQYKKMSLFGSWIFGWYPEEREINIFLTELADKPKDYFLQKDDLFKLLNLIKTAKHSSITWNMRFLFDHGLSHL